VLGHPTTSAHLLPESAYFLATNRNKHSVMVSLKHVEGLEIVWHLVRTMDVLVENYVLGKLATMKLR